MPSSKPPIRSVISGRCAWLLIAAIIVLAGCDSGVAEKRETGMDDDGRDSTALVQPQQIAFTVEYLLPDGPKTMTAVSPLANVSAYRVLTDTSDGAWYAGRISPDGAQILLISEPGADLGYAAVYELESARLTRLNATTDDGTRLFGTLLVETQNLSWSPDGRFLIYAITSGTAGQARRYTFTDETLSLSPWPLIPLDLISTDTLLAIQGSEPVLVGAGFGWIDSSPNSDLDDGHVREARWNPASREVLYSFVSGRRRRLGITSLEGLRHEFPFTGENSAIRPCWGEDQTVVYTEVAGVGGSRFPTRIMQYDRATRTAKVLLDVTRFPGADNILLADVR